MRKQLVNYNKKYAKELTNMMLDFYNSDAVLHNIDKKNIDDTVEMLGEGSIYADVFILLVDDDIAGYSLISKTHSNEAGGIVVWVEEIYLKEKYRKNKYSKLLVEHIFNIYKNAKRFRMEAVKDNETSINLFTSYKFEKLEYVQFLKEN